MNWYATAKLRNSGFSAEAFSAEISRLRVVTSAADRHRLKKLILALLLGGAAGWGIHDLVDEISKQTGLDRSEAVEVVEEVAQESVPARVALQEAEARGTQGASEAPSGAHGYDLDAFYQTLKDYEGKSAVVYPDDAGNPTIGIGHLVTPGDNFDERTRLTEPQIRQLFDQDVQEHIARAERLIPEFPNLPTYLQKELLASVYRGGISGSPHTLQLVNAGRWREAASEFLNHSEYKRRRRSGGDGVTRRMENLRDAMLRYADEQG